MKGLFIVMLVLCAGLAQGALSVTRNGSSFDPSAYGTVIFRTRIQDAALTNGDAISTLVDTISANNLTAAGAARPTFISGAFGGKAGALFSGAQKMTTGTLAQAQPYTMAVVFRRTGITGTMAVMDGDASGRCLCQTENSFMGMFAGTALDALDGYLQGFTHTFIAFANGSSSKMYLNGQLIKSGAAGAQSLHALTIGSGYDNSSPFTGYIAEVIVWSGDATAVAAPFRAYGITEYQTNGGFTVRDTTVASENVRYTVPDVRRSGTALVYCHGLGEDYNSIALTDTKVLYIIEAMGHGYLIASGHNGGDGWGNAVSQAKVEAVVADLVANYGVTDVVLWSQSAGGPLGLLKATQGFTGAAARGWFGIYPIVDIDYTRTNIAVLTSSINSAYPSYPTDATGRDPALFAGSAYNGLRLRCVQSAADSLAPKGHNGDVLVTLATGHATEVTCVATSGDHGDGSNFTQARADDFISFLGRCFP